MAADLAKFARFGINAALLAESGVHRVTDREAREDLISKHAGKLDGILFPYLDPVTRRVVTTRLRRDHPEQENGKPKYLSAFGDRKHLYLTAVRAETMTDVSATAVIVEAEKSALMLRSVSDRTGRPAVPIGTGGCWGWRGRVGKAESADGARVDEVGPLPDLDRITWKNRDVVIWLDANVASNGSVQAAELALGRDLASRGARVRLARTPETTGVNGPDDYRGRTDDAAVLAVLDAAQPARVSCDSVADHLTHAAFDDLPDAPSGALLEPALRRLDESVRGVDSLRRRLVRDAAVARLKELKVSGAAGLVDAALPAAPSTDKTDKPKPALVPSTDAWPDPVDGGTALDAALAVVLRYVVMPKLAAVALVLWVLHSYLMDAWQNSPILALVSPTRRCGKTVLLTVAGKLVYRPLSVAHVTTATLFRLIEKEHPTLLLDEADCWLSDDKSDLRGAVNCGHTKSTAVFPRCEGDNHEVKLYSVWASKLLAMIGKPPATILDRSIVITMRRKAKAESRKPLRTRTLDVETLPIRQQLKRWADDHLADLADAEPVVSDALNDRAADGWRPLLAIADALGGTWPQMARQAALDLSGHADDAEDDGLPIQLLADIAQIFTDADNPVHLETTALVDRLKQMGERPWAELGKHGKGINAHGLSRMLRAFEVDGPLKIRTSATTTVRGWRRDAFTDSWKRYTPQFSEIEAEQTEQANDPGPEVRFSEVEQSASVPLQESEKHSMIPASVPLVPLQTPDTGACDVEPTAEVEVWP